MAPDRLADGMLEFTSYPIWGNAAVFAAGALLVWTAGTKLSRYVDLFADRTGTGKAFAGVLLLGGATSLPELATTLTAASSGAAQLAGNNLIGGIVMQIAVLAFVDACLLRGKPLTLFSPKASLLLVGVMLILLVALASAAISSGELASLDIVFLGHVGIWPVLLFVAYLGTLWLIYQYEGDPRWEPRGDIAQPPETARDLKDAHHETYAETTTKRLAGYFAIASICVLIGGFFVAKTGEAIAEQTGIGEGFIGATLVALATSLPEVSTTYSAVRFGAYSMAAANILGTNSLEVALFLPAELAYRGGLIFDQMKPSAAFLAALGIVVTAIYLGGILERRDKTIAGMGIDSFAVLFVYLCGMAVFYWL
ncbi:sodium:calcium antiporter [Roseiconus lacunae]|uniref:Sodium:calcium antiporter n=1 Tax=Roseiconus lacunae TaxID=2605694 RepID=A0ABT7PP59_9BACT|nr:sodium:calcium antiporter [Roseiconus lacunae]MDM4018273.1 sodium:calcium antiporter [Roseiconus lacunae]WRQ53597.1 sodium:calcium antiporter [Stieleria sp. HD01]